VIVKNPKERSRFIRFAIVGAIGAVVDFGFFNLLVGFTPIAAIWASAASFTAAVVSNFVWNRYWTYPDSRSKPIAKQLTQFVIVSIFGLGIRVIMFALLEIPLIQLSAQFFPPDFFLSATTIGHNVTLALAILVVMFWNFLANRYWTYSDIAA